MTKKVYIHKWADIAKGQVLDPPQQPDEKTLVQFSDEPKLIFFGKAEADYQCGLFRNQNIHTNDRAHYCNFEVEQLEDGSTP